MNQSEPPQMSLPKDYATFSNQQVVAPGANDAVQAAQATADEEAFAHKLTEEQKKESEHVVDHMKVLQPLHDHDGNIIKQPMPAAPQPNPAVQSLAYNNDLNVSTISREANRILKKSNDDEVTISLR